jgi:ABC-2 type transport system permease protein
MREAFALIRAAWLTATSYRVAMLTSLVGLVAVVLPLYFIATALQPAMEQAIAGESAQYFGFVILGAITFSLVSTCTTALPGAIDGAINRGTLEVILGTPARLPAVCVGLMGYGVLWALLRGVLLLSAALALGTSVVWHGVPVGLAILVLTMLCYVGFSLVLSALVLVFRTSGPLSAGLLTASLLLGGVYYPTRVIPSWIRDVADVMPLTYGLRSLRQVVLRGAPLVTILRDIEILTAMAMVSVAVGLGAFALALVYARRAGTLSSY